GVAFPQLGEAFAEALPSLAAENLQHPGEDALRRLQRRLRKHAHELVSAPPDDGVIRAQASPQRADQVLQQPIAGGVAGAVVNRLESVEVDEGDGELAAREPARAPYLL